MYPQVEKRLKQVMASRGKKGTDKREQIQQIRTLLHHVTNCGQQVVQSAFEDIAVALRPVVPMPDASRFCLLCLLTCAAAGMMILLSLSFY
jgi:hypothetical protein